MSRFFTSLHSPYSPHTTTGDIAFHRLFDYISGANEASQKIDMTAPVLNYIQPGAGPNCNSTFTVSFFVPWAYQTEEGPPKPTSEDVFIEEKKVGSSRRLGSKYHSVMLTQPRFACR